MPYTEFTEWQAYFSIYPFTQDREDERAALVAWSITNAVNRLYEVEKANFARKKTFEFKPSKIIDFMPDYLGARKKIITDPLQRAEYAAWKAKAAAVNASVKHAT